MTHRKLLELIDATQVKEAIEKAEEQTSSEICVSVSPLFWGSVKKAAEKAFVRLGVSKTHRHNGVLFFVVPSRRKLVILGDYGIHEKVGQQFWLEVVNEVTERFRVGDFTGGLIKGIERVGQQLATYFPSTTTTNENELPNEVDFQ